MFRSLGQRIWPSLVIITLLWLAVYGPGLFAPPLQDDVDASHADAGREILVRHDWVTLHENNIRYLEKAPPPLLGHRHRHQTFRRSHVERSPLPPPQCPRTSLSALYFFGRRFLTPQSRLLGRRRFPRLVRTVSLHAHPDS